MFTQPLSAMLALRNRITMPRTIKLPLLMKNKRSITTELNTQQLTQETNQTYLQHYPYLNRLPSNSILRARCEDEAQLIHNSRNQKWDNYKSHSFLDPITASESICYLEKKLQYAHYHGKPAQKEEQILTHNMFKSYCMGAFPAPLVYMTCCSLEQGVILTGSLVIPFLALLVYEQQGKNHRILKQLFKNKPKKICADALTEYYQLSDELLDEWKKDQKEQSAGK